MIIMIVIVIIMTILFLNEYKRWHIQNRRDVHPLNTKAYKLLRFENIDSPQYLDPCDPGA